MVNYKAYPRVLYCSFLVFGLAILWGNRPSFASTCHITPVYQGPKQAVIDFAYDSFPAETALTATLPSGGTITVAGPATSGGNRFQHTNLTYGTITYRLSDGTTLCRDRR